MVPICADGARRDEDKFYCGVGNCNVFGYNCEKGCQKASKQDCIQNCASQSFWLTCSRDFKNSECEIACNKLLG